MADKSFGVKELNLLNASGTPTITSPNNLNLNANTVAISTSVTIGHNLTVSANAGIASLNVTGVSTFVGLTTFKSDIHIVGNQAIDINNNALLLRGNNGGNGFITNSIGHLYISSLNDVENLCTNNFSVKTNTSEQAILATKNGSVAIYHDGGNKKLETTTNGIDVTGAITVNGSALSITPTNTDIQVVYNVTANGTSAYRFAGNGVVSTADNPDIFLTRGVKYRFINNSGGSHPFQIRESAGGSAYSTGVTNNGASSGNIDFAPTFDSPSKLVYQCTSHGGMVGNIYMTGGVGRWIQQSIVTLQSGSSYEFTDIPADVNEVMIVFDGLSFDSNSNEIEFLLGHSGGYNTSNYIISASYEPGGNYQKRTTSIRFNGIGSSSYFPTGRLHLWKPVHSNNWWAEGICYPWETEGQYQHRVTGTAPSGGTLSKIKIQGSAGANFDNTGNGKIQLSYIRY